MSVQNLFFFFVTQQHTELSARKVDKSQETSI